MDDNKIFYITTMPSSRMADYYLGWYGGSVFLDFDNTDNGLIKLVRISFDGYGCNGLYNGIPMDDKSSILFKYMIANMAINQTEMYEIIKKTILENKSNLWMDAIMEYDLIGHQKSAQQGDAPEPDSCRSCLSETTSRPGDL